MVPSQALISESRIDLSRPVDARAVWHLASPIVVSMLSRTVMEVTDSVWVAQLGTGPLAAIGIATSVTFVLVWGALGLLRGLKVLVAQASGAGDRDTVRRALGQGIWIALGLAVVALAASFAVPLVVGWMGAGAEIRPMAEGYTRIRLTFGLPTFVLMALSSWLEGRGDTRTPMQANVAANLLNVALDPLFLFGLGPVPAMGMPGAAVATVLSEAIAASWLAFRVREHLRGDSGLRRPDRSVLARTWRFGLPMAVQNAAGVLAWSVFTSFLARAGEVELAAHVMVVRVLHLSFLPGHAIGEAAGILVGHAVGASRPDRAREAWLSSTRLAWFVMGACGLAFLVAPGPFMAPFDPAPEVASIGRSLFLVAAVFQLFDATAMVALGALAGAGDTRFVLRATLFCSWIVNLPLAWALALPFGFGATGAWIALTLEIGTLALLGLRRIRGPGWLERAVPAT